MKMEYFRTVLYVARFKSFSEAAFAIPCAQSSVSRQVQAVEEELGVRIFTRASNSLQVELTKEGRLVVPKIRDIVDKYDNLVDTSLLNLSITTPIDMGVSRFVFPNSVCGSIISNLYRTTPQVYIDFHKIKTSEIDNMLLSHIIDIGLSYRIFPSSVDEPRPVFPDIMAPLFAIPIGKRRMHICMNKNNPLAQKESLTVQDIKDETFLFDQGIAVNSLTTMHRCFLDYCSNGQFKPKMKIVEHSFADVKLLLAAEGEGVFVDFLAHDKLSSPDIVCVPVADAKFYAYLYMVSFSANSKMEAIQSLAEPMKKIFAVEAE